MADNVSITAGSGTTVRTDEVGSAQIQVVKIALGADGAEDNLVDSGQQAMAASLPVVIASNQSAVAVSGTVTAELSATDNAVLDTIDAVLDTINAKLVTGTDIGDVTINNSTGAAAVNIQDGGNTITVDGTVAVTNAGITTIAGAVAGTEMQVDVLTMPALGAGENHLGEVGGKTILATFTLSLDTSAYAIGDVLAATQAVADALRVNSGTGLLQSIKLLDKDDQGAALDLYFLNANNTIGTENDAVGVSDANADAILAKVAIGAADWTDLGGCRLAFMGNLAIPIQAASGTTTLYIAAVSQGTGTYSASGITGILGILCD
jgi:hypothetical protein